MRKIDAERMADRMWSSGDAVGVVRWRRSKTPRFWVGVCFTDGRAPQAKGTSNVNWETAFAVATGRIK
jgi:hypothetical protein